MYIARGRKTNKIYTQSDKRNIVLSFIQNMTLPLPEHICVDQIAFNKTKEFHVIIKKKTETGTERHDISLRLALEANSVTNAEMTALDLLEKLRDLGENLYLRTFKDNLVAVKLDKNTQIEVTSDLRKIYIPYNNLKENRGRRLNNRVKTLELSPSQLGNLA